jgi:hypothetical protein
MLQCQTAYFTWHRAKTSLSFFITFYILFRMQTISPRAARRLIVLHRKQNIETELKWQNLFWHGAIEI